jgi:hypothetical protein
MSAPVVNQAYSQQVNQAFDLFKTFTPQQMQQMGQQVAQKPNSPEAVAFAGAAQYQKQMKAPPPQAPQGTIFQQRLQEFQQTSPQGLPSVGGNQMAMQQAAQQDPMRNAGIGIAPENMPAPQDQAQAATGGLVALAQGGEVRHFEEGGYFGSFNDYGEEYQKQLQGLIPPPSREEAYGTVLEEDKLKVAKDLAEKKSKEHLGDIGQQIDLTGREQPPIISMPTAKVKDTTAPKGIASLMTKNVDPTQFDQAAANADMGEELPVKTKVAPVGKDDILFAPADTSSAARNEAAPTAYEEKEAIKAFRGAEADMSEEVAMAKEAARGANKDKWGSALAQGIGGMLSAQTPYMGQALGAGLMAGASGYSQGAKDEQSANKDLMALQMAQKKALMTGDREAADLYLAQKNAEKTAAAAAAAKWAELKYGKDSAKDIAQMGNISAENIAVMKADNDYAIAQMKNIFENTPNGAELLTASMAAFKQVNENPLTMGLPVDKKIEMAQQYVKSGVTDPLGGMGKQGASTGQAIGSRGISLVGQ